MNSETNLQEYMASIAEVYICMKIAELAKRCGLKASDVDASLDFLGLDIDPPEESDYRLDFGGSHTDPVKFEKEMKFRDLLGLDYDRSVYRFSLEELEDRVDKALALAPRARSI